MMTLFLSKAFKSVACRLLYVDSNNGVVSGVVVMQILKNVDYTV